MSLKKPYPTERVFWPKPNIQLRPELAAYFVPRQYPKRAQRQPERMTGVLAQLAELGSWE